MAEREQPTYYSILPANVRYNNNLKPNEKILFSEITALTNKDGVCYATNEYFSKLYGVTKVAISQWISNLEKEGLIDREIIYADGSKQILNRHIRIVIDPIKQNFNTPIKQNFKDTIYNNTSNEYYKNNSIVEQVDEPISDTINEIISFLNEKAKSSYRSSTPKTRQLIGARLKEKFVLEDFKKVIEFKCQQWLNDAKMSAYIRPETLFGTKFEGYLNEAKRGIGSQVLGSQATHSDEYLEKFRRKRG